MDVVLGVDDVVFDGVVVVGVFEGDFWCIDEIV